MTERDLYHVFPETTRHADASIDGLYVIRTSVPAEQLASDAAVQAYKGLARVERAIRSLKTVDLKVRPIHHRLADRVRAHVFLCMLAYHVEWHMRQVLAPILFDDDDPAGAAARRGSVAPPAQRSESAERKAATRRTSPIAEPVAAAASSSSDLPVHSFQSLLEDLKTLTRNEVRVIVNEPGDALKAPTAQTHMLSEPTPFNDVPSSCSASPSHCRQQHKFVLSINPCGIEGSRG